jgi:hypothetical protein
VPLVVAFVIFAAPAVPRARQEPSPEALKLRKEIQLMEGVLARAGSVAAQSVGSELQKLEPGLTVFIGNSRARGFIVNGYGIFFHVEVPALSGTVLWSQMVTQRELQFGTALAMLKRALEDMPEGPSRRNALQAVSTLDRQAGQSQQLREVASADVKAPATTDAPAAPPASALTNEVMRDPNEAYKQEVKRELIDALLNHSLPLNVAADQWLEVGAHMMETPQGQRGATLMIRVKGSDLAIFAADPTRRDEIRAKVEVREF